LKKGLFCSFFLIFSFFTVFGEEFFLENIFDASLDSSSQRILMGKNDGLHIKLPEDRTLLDGVEIEIKIPREFLMSKAAVTYSFFNEVTRENVTDSPLKKITAQQIHSAYIPSRLSLVLQVPIFADKNYIKSSPYELLVSDAAPGEKSSLFFALFVGETSAEVEDLKFEIFVKPIFMAKGTLDLALIFPEDVEKPVTVTVGKIPIDNWKMPIVLPIGEYHVVVSSDFFRTEVRYFMIEQKKTNSLVVVLRDIKPRFNISAPDTVDVYIDGVFHRNRSDIVVAEGMHIVRFVMGDYEITRSILAELGKSYEITFNIDVNINEVE
jgi:hypothetical protein